ncbi:MAG: hypothetical protein JO265_07515 [Acidimicrobiia bacterium]|nr:hypothetical protein [Acidimicrobiia bacterium]
MPKNNSEAVFNGVRHGGMRGMTTTTARCDKHLFEEATGTCRDCGRPFCSECLVYAQGPDTAPYCIPCALTTSGVRSTTVSKGQRAGKGMTGRLLGSLTCTAVAAAVAIPVLSALH